MHKLTILFLLCFAFVGANSQVYYISGADSLLKKEYNKGSWNNVIQITDSIHKIDMGYHEAYEMAADAAYILNKPFKQHTYLQHALQDYPTDSSVLLKLAYCFWATKQYGHGNKIQYKLLKEGLLSEQNKVKINVVNFDIGNKISSNTSLYNNLNFVSVGTTFPIKYILTYHGITYLRQKSFYGDIAQIQYYLNSAIALKKGWKISGIVHLAEYNLTNYPADLSGNQILSGDQYVLGLGTSKLYRNCLFGVDVIKSNLNYKDQLQIISGITYYPLNNTKLIINIDANYLTEKSHIITSYRLTYSPIKSLNLSLSYLQANTRNFTEQNAFLLHNSFDITRNKYALSVTQQISKNILLAGIFQLENKIETISNANYQYIILAIGIKNIF
jgi:hypothetical protein